jgi:fructokinase
VRAISIGEVLWDVVGTAEHLGGAPFNFAAHLHTLGHDVHFVSAVGRDTRGERVLGRMREMGLSTSYVQGLVAYPTGIASVVLESGKPRFVIHHPAAYDFPTLPDEAVKKLCSPAPDLVYFGTLFQMSPQAREVSNEVLKECASALRFYDVNLREDAYEPSLVRELMARANLVKVNEDEVHRLSSMFGTHTDSLEQFCRSYTEQFGWTAACVTRGAEGCALLVKGAYVEAKGYAVTVADTIGAGDAFAAAFAHALLSGWPAAKIADFANRVGALVSSRPGATPAWTLEEAAALKAE